MSNLNIKIKDGVRLRDPVGGAVLDNSVTHTVPNNKFWRRRISDGDVIDTSKPEILPPETAVKKERIEDVKLMPKSDPKQIGGK